MHPARLEKVKAQLRAALLDFVETLDDEGVEFTSIIATVDCAEDAQIFTYETSFGVDKFETWVMGGSL